MTTDIEVLLRLSAETLLGSPYASGFDLPTICDMMEKKIEKPDFQKLAEHGNRYRAARMEQLWDSSRETIKRKRFEVWIETFKRNR